MTLSQIAARLREIMADENIVDLIKNRHIKLIEQNYKSQQFYPHGVRVYAPGEEIDSVFFGEK